MLVYQRVDRSNPASVVFLVKGKTCGKQHHTMPDFFANELYRGVLQWSLKPRIFLVNITHTKHIQTHTNTLHYTSNIYIYMRVCVCIWVNYNGSLTWNLRPFGDDSLNINHDSSEGGQRGRYTHPKQMMSTLLGTTRRFWTLRFSNCPRCTPKVSLEASQSQRWIPVW